MGRSHAEALDIDGTVYLQAKRPLQPGQFVLATITDADAFDVYGQVEAPA